MITITVTDMAGTSGSVTVDKDDVAEAIRGWFPDAPAEVAKAIGDLQDALDRGDDQAVHGLAAFLALEIKRLVR